MNPAAWDPALTEQDLALFERVVSTDLDEECWRPWPLRS
jgi:hypothetical protein